MGTRRTESVALADNGGSGATSNGILPPSIIIVIHNVEVPKAAPSCYMHNAHKITNILPNARKQTNSLIMKNAQVSYTI